MRSAEEHSIDSAAAPCRCVMLFSIAPVPKGVAYQTFACQIQSEALAASTLFAAGFFCRGACRIVQVPMNATAGGACSSREANRSPGGVLPTSSSCIFLILKCGNIASICFVKCS